METYILCPVCGPVAQRMGESLQKRQTSVEQTYRRKPARTARLNCAEIQGPAQSSGVAASLGAPAPLSGGESFSAPPKQF